MTDYKTILKLCKSGLGNNPIARAVGCKWDTVERVLSKCEAVWGTIKAVPEELSNEEIDKIINRPNRIMDESYLKPNFEEILKKLKNGKSRNDVWTLYAAEAKAESKKAYSPSRFNELVLKEIKKADIANIMQHIPGQEGQADWVGETGSIVNRFTGELSDVYVFVMTLSHSGYFYCEGFLDMKMESWLKGHTDAYEYFQGVPLITIPDNCRTAVIRPSTYDDDPIINERYAQFAEHYRTVIMPARVRRPKDKASVERHVQVIENSILKSMKGLDIFSLSEFNNILHRKMEKVLEAKYQKRDGSRKSIFEEEEKDKLMPLPQFRFDPYVEKEAVVGRDYHIQFDSAFYSLPVRYVGDKVKVRANSNRVKICTLKGTVIAEHERATHKWQRVTAQEHVQDTYRGLGGDSRESFLATASNFGENTKAWVNMVLDSFEFEVQGFRTVSSALHLANDYSAELVDKTCAELTASRVKSSKGFKLLLIKNSKDEIANSIKNESIHHKDLNDIFCFHNEEDKEE